MKRMTRFKILLSLFFLWLSWNCSILDFRGVKIPKDVKEQYTFLVYMVGSDLEAGTEEWSGGAATLDMKEMMSIGSTPNLNIIVTTGGALAWQQPEISAEKIQRWKIEKGEKVALGDSEDTYMSNPNTLKNFIIWGTKNYPANRYALVLWNHGSGSVEGFGLDQNNNRTLKLTNIKTALEEAYKVTGVKFDLIGFDACLMATLETANILAPYSNFMVASEEVEPGHGWDYKSITRAIAEDPKIPGLNLGKTIAQSYEKHAFYHFTQRDITLSVISLNQISSVVKATEKLIEVAGKDVKDPVRFKQIAQARSISEDYGNSETASFDMTDLMDLSLNLKNNYPQESEELIDSLKRAIVFKVRGKAKPAANGLSIYFPGKDREHFLSNSIMYDMANFSDGYTKFIKLYSNTLMADKTPIRFVPSTIEEGPKVSPKERSYEVQINKEDFGDIREIYSVLAIAGAEKNPHIRFFMGVDDNVELKEGKAKYTLGSQWITLNGKFAPLFLLSKSKTPEGSWIKNYAIPIRLNGKKVDLMVLYDTAEKEFEVIGARRPPDKKTNIIPKDLITIKKDDVITILWRFHDPIKNQKGTVKGGEFKVDGKLKFSYSDIPPGEYYLGFYGIDLAGNESYSEYKKIE